MRLKNLETNRNYDLRMNYDVRFTINCICELGVPAYRQAGLRLSGEEKI
jgi:hypothetical protein